MKRRFLQENALHDLNGLERVPGLEVLNVSNNQLIDLSGIAPCKSLQTLICTNNQLNSYESVDHLCHCQELSTLDLQDNNIEDAQVSIASSIRAFPSKLCPCGL